MERPKSILESNRAEIVPERNKEKRRKIDDRGENNKQEWVANAERDTEKLNVFIHKAPQKSAQVVCTRCKGAGFTKRDLQYGQPGFGKPVKCTCKIQLDLDQKRQKMLDLSNLHAFERYRQATFSSYDALRPGLLDAFREIANFAWNPRGWLLIIGDYGVGKTHLAVATLKKYIEETHNTGLILVAPSLLNYLRDTYSDKTEESYNQRMQQICDVNLLVLDDLGSHSQTEWSNEQLFTLLNHRYNAFSPTVITMNPQAWARLDQRLISRFSDKELVRQIFITNATDYRMSAR